MRALREESDKEANEAMERVRTQLVNTLLNGRSVPGLDKEKMLNREPQTWIPKLEKYGNQSDKSLAEQRTALGALVEAVDAVNVGDRSFVRGPILIGPPGAGKTHLLVLGTLYALSKGFNVALLSLTGERALELGGMHLHQFFAIREVAGQTTNRATRIAETSLVNLEHQVIEISLKWEKFISVEFVLLMPFGFKLEEVEMFGCSLSRSVQNWFACCSPSRRR